MSNIIKQNVVPIIENKMGVFGAAVNNNRALPNIKDGLKPVHRRILLQLHNDKIGPRSAHKKVARIVGAVMGAYHPHGDSSIADALTKLSQSFYRRYTMVDVHGNNGTQFGDPAAAMRYIECRQTNYGYEMTNELSRASVNWVDNYDGSEKECVTLPVKVPNLLINGELGIGQAYSSGFAPHNINDVCDLAILHVQGKLDLETLATTLEPDFPTGGVIINKNDLPDIYKTGKGIIRIRARINVDKNGDLVITEIPYMTNTASILDSIQAKVKEGKIEGIKNIKDNSSFKTGVKITVVLKKGTDPSVVENQLYKLTQLESSITINMYATDGTKFRLYNAFEIIDEWYKYRQVTLKRIFNDRISRLRTRIHIIEGLLKALDVIDAIIKIIKTSKDTATAKATLIKKYKLTDLQAENIVDLPLKKLTQLGKSELEGELTEKTSQVDELAEYFTDPKKLKTYIIKELREMKKKFGDDRRTSVTNIDNNISKEALVANDPFTVFITKQGYVKKVTLDMEAQGRGTQGRNIGKIKDDDYIVEVFNANNHDNVLFFTNHGRVLTCKVYDLKESKLNTLGYFLNTYIELKQGEEVVTTLTLNNDDYKNDEAYLVFLTKGGMIKRTSISHYNNLNKAGVIAVRLQDKDELLTVKYAVGEQDLIIVADDGFGARYSTEEVKLQLRNTIGVKALNGSDGQIVAADFIDDGKDVLVVTNKGTGKLIENKGFKPQGRGHKVKFVTKLNDREKVVKVLSVDPEEEVLIITTDKMLKMAIADIPYLIRSSASKPIVKVGRASVKDVILV